MKPLNNSPFVFLGGALALDLVNTEVIVRRQPRDLLATPSDGLAWLQAARTHYPELTTVDGLPPDAWLTALKYLRGALRQIFGKVTAGQPLRNQDLLAVNQILQTGHYVLRAGRASGVTMQYQTDKEGLEQALLPIALSAKWLLTEATPHRLHACRNEHCCLFFYDATRSATRTWCSLDCQNRARSAQNHLRQKRAARLDSDNV